MPIAPNTLYYIQTHAGQVSQQFELHYTSYQFKTTKKKRHQFRLIDIVYSVYDAHQTLPNTNVESSSKY